LDPPALPSIPGSDTFEPGDVEFYLEGLLESRRSYDFRSPVRTDWARLLRYRHCEDVFIIGPNGYSYGCRGMPLSLPGPAPAIGPPHGPRHGPAMPSEPSVEQVLPPGLIQQPTP
jgi:hypothetical protein